MWGFSFDELARRAQEEAAKLAEQAQSTAASIHMQSPGLFNLDSMNTDIPQEQPQPPSSTTAAQQPTSSFFTPSHADVTSATNMTAPPAYGQNLHVNEGNADHISSLVSDVASPRAATATISPTVAPGVGSAKKKKVAVTKLPTTTDDFFGSWGEDDNHAANIPAETIKAEEMYNDDSRGEESSEKNARVDTFESAAEQTVDVDKEESIQEEEPEPDAWENDDLDIADADDLQTEEKDVNEVRPSPEGDGFDPVETAEAAKEEAQIMISEEKNHDVQIDDMDNVESEVDPWGENDLHIADDAPAHEPDDVLAVKDAQILKEAIPDEESNQPQLDVPDVLENKTVNAPDDGEVNSWSENDAGLAVDNDEQIFNKNAVVEESVPPEGKMPDTSNNKASLYVKQIESRAEDQWCDDGLDSAIDIKEHSVGEAASDKKHVSASEDVELDAQNEVKVPETERRELLTEGPDQWNDDERHISDDHGKQTIDDATASEEPVSALDEKETVAPIEEYLKQEEPSHAAIESSECDNDELNVANANEDQQTDKATTEQETVIPSEAEEPGALNEEDPLKHAEIVDEWGNGDFDMNVAKDAQLADEVENDVQINDFPTEMPSPTTDAGISDEKAANDGVETTVSEDTDQLVDDSVEHVAESHFDTDATNIEAEVENAQFNADASQMEESHEHETPQKEIAASIDDDEDVVADQWAEDDIELVASESNEVVDTEPENAVIDEKSDSYDAAENDRLAGKDILEASNHQSTVDEQSTDIANQYAYDPDTHHRSEMDMGGNEISLSQTKAPYREPNEQQSISPTSEDVLAQTSLFDGAQNITAATQSLQSVFGSHASNFFDASKSSAMFSWPFPNAPASNETNAPSTEDTPSSAVYNATEYKPSSTADENPPEPPVIDETADASAMDDLYNDYALDDMYDESSDEGEGNSDEEKDTNEPHTIHDNSAAVEDAKDTTNDDETQRTPEAVPQHVLDKFIKQLERMTESHQLEMDELKRSHKIEIDNLQNELKMERSEKKKAKDREAVAAQDKLLSQMRNLEKTFAKTLEEKEEELEQVMQRNEGNKLKMDSMKREVDGLLRLVDERDDEICRLKRGHGNTMLNLEGNMKVSQEELRRKDAEIRDLKSSMSTLQAEMDSTTESFNTLKSRAKAVATELKDRRVEVRNLTASNEELTTANASLETQLANLQALNDQQRLTIGYKDKDIEALNDKVKELNKQIEAKEGLLQDRSSVGEKAISSYKRKAQEALAAANARLAAANQAREEAESDAKAAKTASDDAVERARISETKRAEAERCATKASSLLESERSANLQLISKLEQTVHELKTTIESMQADSVDAASTKETLLMDIERVKADLIEQMEVNSKLREKLFEEKDLRSSLQKEVNDLRDEVQRSSAAAFKRQKEETLSSENHADSASTNAMMQSSGVANSNGRAEADGTIIMLQQELQGANEAISELKLALRMALLDKTESSAIGIQHTNSGSYVEQDHTSYDYTSNNDITPLFFAIEKQNELNTARDEINRLATMLGDAESEKQDAFDAMEEMRQKMEEANARLLRYEKLGMKSTRPLPTSASTGYASYNGAGYSSLYADSHPRMATPHENDSAVNLEYLKNVMLSYLKAKTLADRRKLVPVIATVLCLTPEEQSQAVLSVEESAGLTGVASSFWENLESKAHNLL